MGVLFNGQPGEPETLEEVIGQAIGASSACWESLGCAGEFQSARAATIATEAIAWVRANYAEKAAA